MYAIVEDPVAKETNPVPTYRGNLTYGDLEIPVFTYNKVTRLPLPTSKKTSALTDDDAGVEMVSVYAKKNDDKTLPDVPVEEKVRGYRYGKHAIPFSAEDEQAAKVESRKHLQILYFAKKSCLRPEYVVDKTILLRAQANLHGFRALMDALIAEDCIAIVRGCMRDGLGVYLYALVPSKTDAYLLKV